MIKKKFAFLAICLFFLAIITSACGSGGKTTPPDNSAFYYLLAQQNTNNNEQERQNESIPDPSPTSDLNQTPNPEPTTEPTQTPTLEVSKSELSLIVGGSEDITVSLDGNPVTDGLQYYVEDESVAKVENGKVTALAKGSTTVTVSLKGANSATFTVENSGKGDYILFGHYRQKPPQTGGDNVDVEEWESQPIEWQILDIDTVNNRVLLLSRYGLDVKRFDENSNVWADSEIRRWLNGDFYYNAFDKLERDKIKPVGIVFNADGSDYYNFDNDTYRVFLLSKAEAEEYFDNDKRKCKPTEYAEKKDANVNSDGYCFWWLRSHSLNYNYYVYYADYFGSISLFNVSSIYFVVRPALWINL